MEEAYWIKLGEKADIIHREAHAAAQELAVRDRHEIVKNGFEELLKDVREKRMAHAVSYFAKRNETDRKLLEVQADTKKMIEDELNQITCVGVEYQLKPASSYTAGTNLIGESDLDYNLIVREIDFKKTALIIDRLQKLGFGLNEVRSTKITKDMHIVMLRYVDGSEIKNVEIEVKIREMGSYLDGIDRIHDYLDNTVRMEEKILITFIKCNLKQLAKQDKANKKFYSSFKALYYEYANACIEGEELIYPLV